MAEHTLVREGRPYWQPQRQAPGYGRGIAPQPGLRALSEGARGDLEDLSHGVVELADAGKTSSERDIAEWEVGGFDQYPSGLRPLSTSQREWTGAKLNLQETLELAGGIADASRKPGDANAIDDAVSDEAHGTSHEITAGIPFGRAW
jgi:hypothetical protein